MALTLSSAGHSSAPLTLVSQLQSIQSLLFPTFFIYSGKEVGLLKSLKAKTKKNLCVSEVRLKSNTEMRKFPSVRPTLERVKLDINFKVSSMLCLSSDPAETGSRTLCWSSDV